MPSELSRHLHLILPYLTGPGLNLGSGGGASVPHAINMDLPEGSGYGTDFGEAPVHLRGDVFAALPFRDQTLSFCLASHVLEDAPYDRWPGILTEWARVLRPGGFLVLLVPERTRFRAAVAAGQPDNPFHQHEGTVGDFAALSLPGLELLREEVPDPGDYSLLAVYRKTESLASAS